MKTGWLFAWMLLLSLHSFGQLPEPEFSGGKYGYRLNGKWIVEPTLQYATHYQSGLALVKQNDLWGYLDSLGNWAVKPVFTNAQPFHNGFAYVFNNGKRGVIGKGGNVILEPDCDSIIDQRNSFVLTKGKLRGFANENFSFTSPVIYTEIDNYFYNYFSCKKTSGKWDIYSRDARIIADAEMPLMRDNFLTNSKLLFLKQQGKYGVYKLNSGWIHEAVYDSIIRTPYPYYIMGDNYFREVFLLWNRGTDPDSQRKQSFQVMSGDGTILSKETFYDLENPLSEEEPIKFISDEVTLFLYPELKAVHLPYNNVRKHLDWYIATSGGKDHILDRTFQEMAVFDKVDPVMVTEPVEYWDEWEGTLYGVELYPEQTPFLVVEKKTGDLWQKALYSLDEKSVVSPYFDSVEFHSVFDNATYRTGYVYKTTEGAEGIYLPGMKTGTETLYQQIALLGDRKIMCTNPASGLGQLWDFSGKRPKLMLEEYSITESSSVMINYAYYDTLTGELIALEPVQAFKHRFYLCQNESGKTGVLCFNGKRTPCMYDSINQNSRFDHLLNVMIAGRYGILNLINGETIAPFSEFPLKPDFNAFRGSYYVANYESDETGTLVNGYYQDQYGRYYTQFLSDNSRKFKEKGKVGLMAYNEFNDSQYVAIPPLYKALEWKWTITELGVLFAKGSNGKWGMLDFKGDTVVPFMYKKFTDGYFLYNENTYYKAENGKKWALFDQFGHCLIPPGQAEEWQELFPSEGYSGLISYKQDEKYGVTSYDGSASLPCIFEDVSVRIPYGSDAYGPEKHIQVKQNGKWWVLRASVPIGYEQFSPPEVPEIILDTIDKQGPYDFIIGDWYIRENKPGDFRIERLAAVDELIQEHGPLPPFHEGNTGLFVENGKIGIRVLDDMGAEKTVLPPTFTNVSFNDEYTVLVHDKGQSFYYDFTTKKRFNIESW